MPSLRKGNNPTQPESIEKRSSHTEKNAYELYEIRLMLDREGDRDTDWRTAEKISQSQLRLFCYRCNHSFINLEKNIWEPLLFWANNQAWLGLLGLIGNAALIVAITTYITSEKHRRNAEVLNDWLTITSAHGKAGSGGRIQSLELNKASTGANWRRKFPWFCAPLSLCIWPAESLDGIDLAVENSESVSENAPDELLTYLTVEGIDLHKIQLPKASLRRANMKEAYLRDANFQRAILLYANLEGADLVNANLSGADLTNANLQRTSLRYANLERAQLEQANMTSTNQRIANLAGADLPSANLA